MVVNYWVSGDWWENAIKFSVRLSQKLVFSAAIRLETWLTSGLAGWEVSWMSTLGLSSLKFCGSVEIMCQRVFLIVARLRAWNPHGYWQLPTVSKAVLQKVLHDWCLYNCTFPNRWGKKKAPVSNQISLDGLRKKKLNTCSTFWETSKYNISIENTVYDSAKNT